ncbi:MAG: alkaline phosphatase family protein [Myxococcota bacterium]
MKVKVGVAWVGACCIALAMTACGGDAPKTEDTVPPEDTLDAVDTALPDTELPDTVAEVDDDGLDADTGDTDVFEIFDPNGPVYPTSSKIEHLVLIVMENHTFDSYFARWCTAATGSAPDCTEGHGCCEAGPDTVGISPMILDDSTNGQEDRNHDYDCELDEINGGAMDRFVFGLPGCAKPANFAYAELGGPAAPYHDLAVAGALADHWFQPVVGQTSSNDMFFARAGYVFKDNDAGPSSIGKTCSIITAPPATFFDTNIGDLLDAARVTWTVYAEGYDAMVHAVDRGNCPRAPTDCPIHLSVYPCIYDPTDIPFNYYPSVADDPDHMKDLQTFHEQLALGQLPAWSYLKPIGYKTNHPGYLNTISAGANWMQAIVEEILASPIYADNTLVLITMDEGGGFYDHVPPPPANRYDRQPYGTRVPTIAVGPFVKPGTISHVVLEHSSIVKFIEWNFLGGTTGQLGTRDANVHNIGSLLDATKTGTPVPSD